jgi:hypothetical protein
MSSRLPCNQPINMGVDRGRILPLGGASASNTGYTAGSGKTVDTPNAYKHFSRRNPPPPSRNNDSQLTPRHGAMSALGEPSLKVGLRYLTSERGGTNSYMNEEQLTPRSGLRMTGMEQRIVDHRTYMEDNPRKLTKAVPAPERPALDHLGRVPFITGNGLIGKTGVSPAKGRKNTGTTVVDIDTRNTMARQALEETGVQPQRYCSPFRAVATDRAKSPIAPETLPLHPEVEKSGLAKVQRFQNPSLRHTPSLTGVFTPQERKPPPPYKLIPPWHVHE